MNPKPIKLTQMSDGDYQGAEPQPFVVVGDMPGGGGGGQDGKSAYQIAVDNGFVGTEEQWLASLKGADGSSTGVSDADWGLLRAAIATRNTSPVPIVFTGSSTASGSGASQPDRAFTQIVAKYLQGAFPLRSGAEQPGFTALADATTPLRAGIQGIGAAVSGSTANTFLTQQTREAIGALNPRCVVVMVGSNNYHGNVPPLTFKSQLSTQLDALRGEITGPCLFILCHQYRRGDVAEPAYSWDDYGTALRDLSDETPDTVFVDFDREFAAAGAPSPDPFRLIEDTVHPSDAGHSMLADILINAMQANRSTGAVTPQPEPSGLIAADDFNRADGDLGTTSTGAKEWAVLASSSAIQIASGRAAIQSGNGTALVDSGVSDLDISADFEWNTGQVGVVFRVGSLLNSSTRLTVTLSADGLRYYGYNDGSLVTQDLDTSWTPTPGETYRLRVVVEGTDITAFIDDVQRATFSVGAEDSATFANTVVGLRSSQAGNYADNFEVSTA